MLTHRLFIGAMLLVAALLCALVVGIDPLVAAGSEVWTEPIAQPRIAQGLALVLVVAGLALAASWYRRRRGDGEPDRRFGIPPDGGDWQGRLATAGVVMLAAGTAVLVGYWLTAHSDVPTGELVLPLGEPHETVQLTHGDRDVDVQLPMRTTAHFVDLQGDAPEVWLQFSTPDAHIDNPTDEQLPSLRPGESLDVEDTRFVFTGFSRAERQQRAFLSSPDDDTRDAAGYVGDEIQLSLDGPTFRIVDITDDYIGVFADNYRPFYLQFGGLTRQQAQLLLIDQGYPLGAMGPAVQLEDEDGRTFWVFQRGGEQFDESPYTGESLVLEGIQEVPSPVVTVTPVRPVWPFGVGGVLIVVGFALLFAFPAGRVRDDEGGVGLWSLNRVERPGDGASGSWGAKATSGAGQQLAIGGLALALGIGSTPAGILAAAGLVAAVGLPLRVDDAPRVRATMVATAVVVALVVGAVLTLGAPGWSLSMDSDRLLWTAQIGAWLAMAVALVGAGILAENSLPDRSTGGAVTAALGVWAAMGVVVALGLTRGLPTGQGLGLPLFADGEPLNWAIPHLDAVAELQIPAVIAESELGALAAAVAVLVAVGVGGAVVSNAKLALFGWIGSLVASVTGVLQIWRIGTGGKTVDLPDAQPYQQAAAGWLETKQLPDWIAEMGRFQTEGGAEIPVAALFPEMMAFVFAVAVAAAMIAVVVLRRHHDASPTRPAPTRRLAGRDLFVRAVLFGVMGWFLGLVIAWEHLGAAGVLAPMEWLGLGAVLAALGLLVLGWRRGPSGIERFFRAYGPAIALCVLVWVLGIGASGAVAPGSALPLR